MKNFTQIYAIAKNYRLTKNISKSNVPRLVWKTAGLDFQKYELSVTDTVGVTNEN